MELANGSQLCSKEKRLWTDTLGHSHPDHKTIFGWKFRVQDLLHEPKVLLVSLAHLVACMCWAHAKGLKGIDPYPPNYTSLISLVSHIGLGHA